MKKISKSTLVLIIIFVIGLSLMLYPVVSDYWNSFHQSRAIASYVEAVNNMDQEEYDALLAQAQAYNQSLVGHETRFVFSDEEEAEYLSLLGSTGGAVGYIEIPTIKASLPIWAPAKRCFSQAWVPWRAHPSPSAERAPTRCSPATGACPRPPCLPTWISWWRETYSTCTSSMRPAPTRWTRFSLWSLRTWRP